MTDPQFRLIKSLCQLSQKIISQSNEVFRQTKLFVPQVRQQLDLLTRSHAITEEFITSTQNTFGRSLDLSSILKEGDFFVSGLGTNFQYSSSGDPQSINVYPYPANFRDENDLYCSCYTKPSCTQAVYTYFTGGSIV